MSDDTLARSARSIPDTADSGAPSYQAVRIEDIPYQVIDGTPLMLDIVRPDPIPDNPMPVLLHLFGGAWMHNNRKAEEQNRNTFFAAHGGFFTVSVDYRVSSQAIFPAQIADARAAVRWLRTHADTYHLDPDRIGAYGYSSGGHLAALLGTGATVSAFDTSQDASRVASHVQAVVTIAAPTDFRQMGGWHDAPDSPEALLVGGPLHERTEIVRLANPITHVSPAAPPFLLIHGEQDEIVPIGQSRLLYDALVQAGVQATFMPLSEAGHDLTPGTPHWDGINKAALAFFGKHLGGSL